MSDALPAAKAIKELFSGLLDKDVIVDPGTAFPVNMRTETYVGVYGADDESTGAVIVLDLPLAAWLGGALGLMPATQVQDSVNRRTLPPLAEESIGEVFNIAASLVSNKEHMRLSTTIGPEEKLPLDVFALANARHRRIDLNIEVPGYGKGALSAILSPAAA